MEKMKKMVFSLVASLLFLSSCSGVDPVAWNAEMIGVYNKTLDDIEDFQDLISLETIGDIDVKQQIEYKGRTAIADLDKSILYISEGNIPSGAESYRTAVVEMLEAAKEQINVGLLFVQLTENTTDAEIDEYADKYDLASVKTAKKVDAVTIIQKQFADVEDIALK